MNKMTCLCKQIAGNDIELSTTCIGSLWIFQGLAPKDVKALAQKVLFKKNIIFEIFLKSTFLIPKRWF